MMSYQSCLAVLFFEGSIPTCTVFIWKTFLFGPAVFFLLFFFRNSKRREAGERKMHGLKAQNCVVHKQQSIIINSNASK